MDSFVFLDTVSHLTSLLVLLLYLFIHYPCMIGMIMNSKSSVLKTFDIA